jgi:hypothetical protein
MSKLVTIASFDNPIDAHIIKTKLESYDIECSLFDENIVWMKWYYSNAVGDIKLRINEDDVSDAIYILELDNISEETICPECQSSNFREIVLRGWLAGIFKLILLKFFDIFALAVFYKDRRNINVTYQCQDCGCEWKQIISY